MSAVGGGAVGLPLLRSKLSPAGDADPLLARPALLDALGEAARRPLLILSAPAGFGKSTALGQFYRHLQQQGARVAWLGCDEADSDPLRLLSYLDAAIARAWPELRLRPHPEAPVERRLGLLLDGLAELPGPLHLFLDDLHRLGAPAARLARQFIEGLPAQVRLLAGMRACPAFLHEPGLQARIGWITGEQLRLGPDETARYLHEVCRVQLAPSQLTRLARRGEGWITALQLVARTMPCAAEPEVLLARLCGTQRSIADYLAEDVLDALPATLQRFLERTALLDEFTAELCAAVTGAAGAAESLARLQREQLFVSALPGEPGWLRYDRLFAEFLRGRLARREDPAPLLLAAARWCEEQGFIERAIGYALRAGQFAFAAQLLERHGARLIAGNRLYGLLRRLEEVPAEQRRRHPVFELFYAWQLALEHRYAEAETLIEDVGARLLRREAPVQQGVAGLLAAAQVLKALLLLHQEKLEHCLAVTRRWLERAPAGQRLFRASLRCVQAAALALLFDQARARRAVDAARIDLQGLENAYLQVMVDLLEALLIKRDGELKRAQRLIEAACARAGHAFGRGSRLAAPLALAHAELLYEQGRLSAAAAPWPPAAHDVATPLELLGRGQLAAIRARFFGGDAPAALAQLDAWLAGLQAPGHERLCAKAMGCRVQLLLWLGRPNEAERVCLQLQRLLVGRQSELRPPELRQPGLRQPEAFHALLLAQARLGLCEGRSEQVQGWLEDHLADLAQPQSFESRLRVSLLLAVAHWQRNQDEKAFALLEAQLLAGWRRGYRRLFLDDALWLLPLLRGWLAQQPQRALRWGALGEALRAQFRRLGLDPDGFCEHREISHREREILRLVAAGLSNRDIAQLVHLSEATVKWHLHNLFAKLEVRSRTQAVLTGKRLGLLREA